MLETSTQLVHWLNTHPQLANGTWQVTTGDINALYTNMHHWDTINTILSEVCLFYSTYSSTFPYDTLMCWLCAALEVVIKFNFFLTPDIGYYSQHVGIAMGTNCAPMVANLFLFHHLHKAQYHGTLLLYIDKILLITPSYIVNPSSAITSILPPYLCSDWMLPSPTAVFLDVMVELILAH